jgi:hypothetical protein
MASAQAFISPFGPHLAASFCILDSSDSSCDATIELKGSSENKTRLIGNTLFVIGLLVMRNDDPPANMRGPVVTDSRSLIRIARLTKCNIEKGNVGFGRACFHLADLPRLLGAKVGRHTHEDNCLQNLARGNRLWLSRQLQADVSSDTSYCFPLNLGRRFE